MKEKHIKYIKILLILIGALSLLWGVISGLGELHSLRKIIYILPMFVFKICEFPWPLLGLICLFVGIIIPLKNNKNSKVRSDVEENKQKKLWKSLLITGIVILSIPIIVGIYDAIVGTNGGGCVGPDCRIYYGFPAFKASFLLTTIMIYRGYILGLVLVIISTIKLLLIKFKNKKK